MCIGYLDSFQYTALLILHSRLLKCWLEEQKQCLISSQANKIEDVLLNVKMRAINNVILEHGLIVKLLDVFLSCLYVSLTLTV